PGRLRGQHEAAVEQVARPAEELIAGDGDVGHVVVVVPVLPDASHDLGPGRGQQPEGVVGDDQPVVSGPAGGAVLETERAGTGADMARAVRLEVDGVAGELLVGAEPEVEGNVLRVREAAVVPAEGDNIVADPGTVEGAGVVPAEHDPGLKVIDVQP